MELTVNYQRQLVYSQAGPWNPFCADHTLLAMNGSRYARKIRHSQSHHTLNRHGFSRAKNQPREARTTLPKAGAQPQAKRPTCLPSRRHHFPHTLSHTTKMTSINNNAYLTGVQGWLLIFRHPKAHRSFLVGADAQASARHSRARHR
jgi:hypothetical protein